MTWRECCLVELGSLGDADLGGDPFLGRGNFRGRNDERNGGSIEFDNVEFRWLFSVQNFMQLAQILDFLPVDLFDDQSLEFAHVSGEAVVFHTGEDDNVLVFAEETFGDVVGEKLAKTLVFEVEGGEEIEVERLEDKACEEGVARSFFVSDGMDAGEGEGLQGDFLFELLAIAHEGEGHFVPGKLAFHDFVHVHKFGADADIAGAVDGVAINGEEDIAPLKNAIGRTFRDDIGDEDSFAALGHVVGLAHGGVEESEGSDAEIHVVIVRTIFDILEEAVHDRSRDDISDVVGLSVALEGDTYHLAVLDDWTS